MQIAERMHSIQPFHVMALLARARELEAALGALERTTGDEVAVPGEHGQVNCKILDVSGLSDEVERWIGG